jgi:type VI secretion system protein ImpA
MISVEELLKPIEGSNPSGTYLRNTPIYDKIRDARREDDNLPQGEWKQERKVADYQLLIREATQLLRHKSKDLQLAAWLTDGLLRTDGFAGLLQGLGLCSGLLDRFWDTVYPEIDDGDLELRAAPLGWLGIALDDPVRRAALTRDGYNWYQHEQSRLVGYEEQNKEKKQKESRDKKLAEGKLAPEVFDKSVAETPKAYYLELEKNLDSGLKQLALLTTVSDEKFGDSAPAFGKLRTSLEDVRNVARRLLQKKRESEPDPVIPEPVAEAAASASPAPEGGSVGESQTRNTASVPPERYSFTLPLFSESAARQKLVEAVAASAAALRRAEPFSPAAYLMIRGLRWGDLRMAAALSDPRMLEAPPTGIRQQIKRLALDEKWHELLDASESVMAHPCSRAWLDLQRFVVEACVALGSEYDAIAIAIRSELRCLLRDVPQLLLTTLEDDTPAANDETRRWLREILAEPAQNGPGPVETESIPDEQPSARWHNKFVDSNILAKEALRAGQPDKAIEIMNQEINRQRSSRGRFQRQIQFVELCVAAGKDAIVQPLLEDLIAAIDAHKLEDWEDKGAMAAALVTVVRASKRIQGDAKEKQKFFERICRLDPVRALDC